MYQATKTRLGVTMMGAILAMIVAAVAMAVSASPAKADHASYQSNCSVEARAPNVTLNSAGQKVGRANGKVYCSSASGRYVQLQIQLWEDDATSSDDFITGWYPTGSYLINAGTSRAFYTGYVGCNYDSVGKDELYTKTRFSVYTGSNGWGPWTGWAKSGYIEASC